MPLPMVHLAVAVHMYGVDRNGDFLPGNISPDAIPMRPNTELQDTLSLHLADLPGQRYESARQLLARYRSNEQDANGNGFAGGHAAHLLTDTL